MLQRLIPACICLTTAFLSASVLSQTISTVVIEVHADSKHIVITGSGFSAADEVTVAGISLEKISVTDSRIEAAMPGGIRLVGGEYQVKVSGRETVRASLHVSSDVMHGGTGPGK